MFLRISLLFPNFLPNVFQRFFPTWNFSKEFGKIGFGKKFGKKKVQPLHISLFTYSAYLRMQLHIWHISCIFFSILYCILFTYLFTYFAYATSFAYFFIHIFCISVNIVEYSTYFIAYFSACFMACVHIFAYFAYFAYFCIFVHDPICRWTGKHPSCSSGSSSLSESLKPFKTICFSILSIFVLYHNWS